jgi:hypothetical protein
MPFLSVFGGSYIKGGIVTEEAGVGKDEMGGGEKQGDAACAEQMHWLVSALGNWV